MPYKYPEFPAEWFLAMTDTASRYVAARFQSLIHNPPLPAPLPTIILDTDIVIACDQLADCLNEAYRNPVYIKHDMGETGIDDNREDSLLRRFPPGHRGTIYLERPAVVVASEGTIVVWYLPGALSRKTQKWNSSSNEVLQVLGLAGCIGGARMSISLLAPGH
ncbi:hypothetical protein BDR04DRAFT_1123384 [Suillus decipiens]|nr:hypothetical protein BDR04DRAFT_1123384 [Suillus decipiens]